MQFAKLTEMAKVATGPDLFYTHYALFVLQKCSFQPIAPFQVNLAQHLSGFSRIKQEWKLAKGVLESK